MFYATRCAFLSVHLWFATIGTIASAWNTTKETNDERIILSAYVMPFHGSSSLEALLRTSQQVGTLCSMQYNGKNIWQCEPGKTWVDVQTLEIIGTAYGKNTQKQNSSVRHGNQLPKSKQLDFYGRYWELDRPVLFCKFCFDQKFQAEIRFLRKFDASSTSLSAFWDAGITTLRYAEIVVWRPLCMHRLSRNSGARHVRSDLERERARKYLLAEVSILEDAYRRILSNRESMIPSLTVGLHELTWSTRSLSRRILFFLPWIFKLDPLGNHTGMKSIENFGSLHPPEECCGFDTRNEMCSFMGPEFAVLEPGEMAQVRNVSRLLVNAPRSAKSMAHSKYTVQASF